MKEEKEEICLHCYIIERIHELMDLPEKEEGDRSGDAMSIIMEILLNMPFNYYQTIGFLDSIKDNFKECWKDEHGENDKLLHPSHN